MNRALFTSHTGMSEPLGRSQVVPYLRGLARAGWSIEVVAFEPADANPEEVTKELASSGIRYSWTRRSDSHALPVKLAEAMNAFSRLLLRAIRQRPRVIHARSTLPAAVAFALARLAARPKVIFDCRGLLADEYVDAGHWKPGSLRYSLVKRAERVLFSRADAVVTLTERLRGWLSLQGMLSPSAVTSVIPCCVDLARFDTTEEGRVGARRRLGSDDRFVLAYSGSLNSWYCEEQMAQLYAAVRRRRPAHFAVFTRSPAERLRAALRRLFVPESEVSIEAVSPSEIPGRLAAANAAVSFITPSFSKMASSPTKIAEYLALGLPVALNRGVGDVDRLLAHRDVTVDAGAMTARDLEQAADRLTSMATPRAAARELARHEFGLEEVGVKRYRELYERLSS